jgi:hypothetical protein
MDDTFHSADNWERCVLFGQNEADTEEKTGSGLRGDPRLDGLQHHDELCRIDRPREEPGRHG